MKLTIRTGLIAIIAVLVACLGLVGLVTTNSLKQVRDDFATVGNEQLPIMRVVGDLKYTMTRYRLRVLAAQTPDREEMMRVKKDLAAAQADIDASVTRYEQLVANNPAQLAIAKRFSEGWRSATQYHDQVLSLGEAGQLQQSIALYGAESKTTFNAAIAILNESGDLANTHTKQMVDSTLKGYDLTRFVSWSVVFLGVALGVLGLLFLNSQVTSPINRLVGVMQSMTRGQLSADVPYTDRRNELGDIARALNVFRDALSQTETLRTDREATERSGAERLRSERAAIADAFNQKMGALAQGFVMSAEDVAHAAQDLSTTAEDTSRKVAVVAGAAEAASGSVATVAAGAEELSASIREIGDQVNRSAGMASDAALEASRTDENIRQLSASAQKIGDVVALIQAIAAQTNLLALNATIEAARAGEAGKGFAVVASEVKQLASQTAGATNEITMRINEIQAATDVAVQSIDNIVRRVGAIREVTTAIAAAVEQQGAATNEIAGNTQRAAMGAGDVTGTIHEVGAAANRTGAASSQLMKLSQDLSDRSENLMAEVEDFVATLRSA